MIHNCFNDGGVEAKTLELPTSGDAFREYLGDGHFFETGGKNDAQLDTIDAVRFSLETVLLAYAAILEKADAAGSGAARTQAAENVFAKISPTVYYGALRKIPSRAGTSSVS